MALDGLGEGSSFFQGGRAGSRRTSTLAPKVPKEQASSSSSSLGQRLCLRLRQLLPLSLCQRLHLHLRLRLHLHMHLCLQGRNQKGQGLSQRSPGKQVRRDSGPVMIGSENVPSVRLGKAQAHTAVGLQCSEMQGDVLRGTRVWPSYSETPLGKAGGNPGKRKPGTSKLRSLSAPASREGTRAKNEQQAASGPLRHISISPKALKQRVQCSGLEIRATGAQRKTALAENKDHPGPGTPKPDSKGASAAYTPPVPKLRRSLRIASQKKKPHVLCALCGLPEREPQVHS